MYEGLNDDESVHYDEIYAPPRLVEENSPGARALRVLDLVVPMLQEGIRDPLIIETVTHIERSIDLADQADSKHTILPGKRLYTKFKAEQEMKKAERAVVRAAENYTKTDSNLDKREEENGDQKINHMSYGHVAPGKIILPVGS